MQSNTVITIGREYGSGGHVIGKKLSEKLGVPFYDQEIISFAAKESGYAEEMFKKADEQKTTSLLFSLAMGTFPYTSKMSTMENLSLTDKLYEIQKNAIIGLAKQEPCVIVGRCSNYILRYRCNCLNVFIGADMDKRMETVCQRDGIDVDKAKSMINMMDKKRGSYYNYYTGEKWGHREYYDMCINSSTLGLDGTVELIAQMAYMCKKEG